MRHEITVINVFGIFDSVKQVVAHVIQHLDTASTMRPGCASFAPHPFPTLPPNLIRAIDPHALKIPARKAECI